MVRQYNQYSKITVGCLKQCEVKNHALSKGTSTQYAIGYLPLISLVPT